MSPCTTNNWFLNARDITVSQDDITKQCHDFRTCCSLWNVTPGKEVKSPRTSACRILISKVNLPRRPWQGMTPRQHQWYTMMKFQTRVMSLQNATAGFQNDVMSLHNTIKWLLTRPCNSRTSHQDSSLRWSISGLHSRVRWRGRGRGSFWNSTTLPYPEMRSLQQRQFLSLQKGVKVRVVGAHEDGDARLVGGGDGHMWG